MNQTTIKVGDEFASDKEFSHARKQHENSTHTNLVITNSCKLQVSSSITQEEVNENEFC